MTKKLAAVSRWLLPLAGLATLAVLAVGPTPGNAAAGSGVPPGTRIQGSRADFLLVLHNLGSGDGLRVNSEGGGPGVSSLSWKNDGIFGQSYAQDRAGVSGHGQNGVGVRGRSEKIDGVLGVTVSPKHSGVIGRSERGLGVTGYSVHNDGVVGHTDAASKSGVYGWSDNGIGVTAHSSKGTALFVNGSTVFRGYANFEGGHGDLAENYHSRGPVEAGDVVVIDPAGGMAVTVATRADDTSVAGIVSTSPTLRIQGRIDDALSVPLVIAGRVACKVDASYGAIAPGDLLTSSPTPGHAKRAEPVEIDGVEVYLPGTIVGKALEPLTEGRGAIAVLVTLQ